MGWGIAGGVLGLILMFGAYRWLMGWSTARSGAVSVPTIGSRPRRLAGVPEEAPAGAKMPPAMEVLRHGEEPIVLQPRHEEQIEDIEGGLPGEEVVLPSVDFPVDEALKGEAGEEEAPFGLVVDSAEIGVVVKEVNHGTVDQLRHIHDTGEFVIIANHSRNAVDLENWRLTDEGENHAYLFPQFVLDPGAEVTVHMWPGEDTETDLYVGRRNPWWNDEGDTAYLYDAEGEIVHLLETENQD